MSGVGVGDSCTRHPLPTPAPTRTGWSCWGEGAAEWRRWGAGASQLVGGQEGDRTGQDGARETGRGLEGTGAGRGLRRPGGPKDAQRHKQAGLEPGAGDPVGFLGLQRETLVPELGCQTMGVQGF